MELKTFDVFLEVSQTERFRVQAEDEDKAYELVMGVTLIP